MGGIISDGETRTVKSGRIDSNTVIDGGEQIIRSGGKAVSATVLNWGAQRVLSGGRAVRTNVRGGTQTVSKGGIAQQTRISISGWQDVWAGGSSIKAQIYSGGIADVYGGTLKGASIRSGGQAWVHSGRAIDVTVHSGGLFSAGYAASATGIMIKSGGAICADVKSGAKTKINGLAGSRHFSLSGGTASGFVLWSGASLGACRGGKIIDAIVRSGGTLAVSSGGSVTGAKIFRGGILECEVDGKDLKTYAKGTINGSAFLLSKGQAWGLAVSSGGEISVRNGGKAYGLRIASGGGIECAVDGKDGSVAKGTVMGRKFSISGGSASGVILWDGGRQEVKNGGKAYGTLLAARATQTVSAKGTAYGTSMRFGAGQTVFSGGKNFSARIGSGASQRLLYGGKDFGSVVLSGGTQIVSAGASSIKACIRKGGTQILGMVPSYYPLVITDPLPIAYVASTGADVSVSAPKAGAIANEANSIAVPYPYYPVSADAKPVSISASVAGVQDVSAGSAIRADVRNRGVQIVHSGASALKTVLRNGGRQTVCGGKASGTKILDGGIAEAVSGGILIKPTVSRGWIGAAGGSISAASIMNGGRLVVSWGGAAVNANVHSGGAVSALAGAAVSGLVLKKGAKAFFADGTVLGGTNVIGSARIKGEGAGSVLGLAKGAKLTVLSRADFGKTAIEAGQGRLVLAGRGISAGSISATAGGALVFRVSNLRPGGVMLKSGVAKIASKASLSIEADAFQRTGRYALASGFAAGQQWTINAGGAFIGRIASGVSAVQNGIAWSVSVANKHSAAVLSVNAVPGAMLKAKSSGGAVKGTSACDVFANGAGNDAIQGRGGRDCAVWGREAWGQDTVAKTSGTMHIVFSGLKASDVTSSLSGGVMTFTKTSDATQKIAVSGWHAKTHSILFAETGAMNAFAAWTKATSPTVRQEASARTEVWKKAGLANA